MIRANRVIAVVLIVLGASMFFWSHTFPEKSVLWPRLFSVVLILLSLALIYDSFKNPHREGKDETGPGIKEFAVLAVICGGLALYLLLLNIIGFSILTVFLIAGLLWYGGYKKAINVWVISISTSIVITIIFQVFLRVPIPQGLLQNFL